MYSFHIQMARSIYCQYNICWQAFFKKGAISLFVSVHAKKDLSFYGQKLAWPAYA